MSEQDRIRAEFCKPVQSMHEFSETPYRGSSAKILSFQGIRASINAACARCHQFPAKTNDFSYVDSLFAKDVSDGTFSGPLPGFSEAAEKMRNAIFHSDPKKRYCSGALPPSHSQKWFATAI